MEAINIYLSPLNTYRPWYIWIITPTQATNPWDDCVCWPPSSALLYCNLGEAVSHFSSCSLTGLASWKSKADTGCINCRAQYPNTRPRLNFQYVSSKTPKNWWQMCIETNCCKMCRLVIHVLWRVFLINWYDYCEWKYVYMEEQDFFGEIWHMMRSKYVINFTTGYEKAKVVSLVTALARVGFLLH